jgi:hypothetical protein
MWADREEFMKWAMAIYAMVGPGEAVPAFVVRIPAEPLPLTGAEMEAAQAAADRWLSKRT